MDIFLLSMAMGGGVVVGVLDALLVSVAVAARFKDTLLIGIIIDSALLWVLLIAQWADIPLLLSGDSPLETLDWNSAVLLGCWCVLGLTLKDRALRQVRRRDESRLGAAVSQGTLCAVLAVLVVGADYGSLSDLDLQAADAARIWVDGAGDREVHGFAIDTEGRPVEVLENGVIQKISNTPSALSRLVPRPHAGSDRLDLWGCPAQGGVGYAVGSESSVQRQCVVVVSEFACASGNPYPFARGTGNWHLAPLVGVQLGPDSAPSSVWEHTIRGHHETAERVLQNPRTGEEIRLDINDLLLTLPARDVWVVTDRLVVVRFAGGYVVVLDPTARRAAHLVRVRSFIAAVGPRHGPCQESHREQ